MEEAGGELAPHGLRPAAVAGRRDVEAREGAAPLHLRPAQIPRGRAAVKAEEYEDEIHDSKKAHVGEDGRRLLGCDYVLDWLRGTVVSEDPYNLYVFFLLLRSEEDRGIGARFHIQRVKNKFFDERYPNLIRTNALINLLLLYPADAKAFEKSGIRGKWDAKFAGEPCASVEVQLTLNDYLTIKNLMHTYYDVMRAEDPLSFLIENPIFVDADTLAPAEDEKDLAAASARVERLELELAAAREHEKGLVEARMAELERMIAGASADQLPRGSGRAAASLQRSKTAPALRERAASGGAGDVAAAPVTPPQEGASSPERVATPRTHVPSPEPEATPVPRDERHGRSAPKRPSAPYKRVVCESRRRRLMHARRRYDGRPPTRGRSTRRLVGEALRLGRRRGPREVRVDPAGHVAELATGYRGRRPRRVALVATTWRRRRGAEVALGRDRVLRVRTGEASHGCCFWPSNDQVGRAELRPALGEVVNASVARAEDAGFLGHAIAVFVEYECVRRSAVVVRRPIAQRIKAAEREAALRLADDQRAAAVVDASMKVRRAPAVPTREVGALEILARQ